MDLGCLDTYKYCILWSSPLPQLYNKLLLQELLAVQFLLLHDVSISTGYGPMLNWSYNLFKHYQHVRQSQIVVLQEIQNLSGMFYKGGDVKFCFRKPKGCWFVPQQRKTVILGQL